MVKHLLNILVITALLVALPCFAETREYSLVIAEEQVYITGKPLERVTVNGDIPAPTLQFNEGEEAVIHVSNEMDEYTSIHWHGLLLAGLNGRRARF